MKTALSPTLTLYIGGRFFAWLLGVSVLLGCITLLGDSIELLRRSADKPDVTFALVMLMAILKLPATAQEVMPFGLLAATLGCLTQLSRTSELIIVRASGASIWQVLLPALLLGLVVGVVRVGAFDSLAASSTERYEQMQKQYMNSLDPMMVTASTSGLWLRQASDTSSYILNARGMDQTQSKFDKVVLLSFDANDHFTRRIDAANAVLRDQGWILQDVQIIEPNKPPQHLAKMTVPAKLTYDQLMESFAAASTLSFWKLPGFISILEASGLPSRAHRLKYQRLLATPLLFVGIILLATSFGLRLPRFGGLPLAIGAGAMSGFLLYFLSSLAAALGVNSSMPLALAAWGPAAVTAILGITLLLYVEDG